VKQLNLTSALCAVLLSACSSDECPSLHACDIRKVSCQRETAEVTKCLRGGTTPAPRVAVVDADDFIAAQEDMAEEPEAEQDARRGLALLRLMPRDSSPRELARQRWDNVGAFFDPDSGGVTILDRNKEIDSPWAVILLLHEYVHAMQHADASP